MKLNLTSSYPSIIFLTGVSGVGKSTLLHELSQSFPDSTVEYLHFDSIGVPNEEEMVRVHGSGSAWQKAMTHCWVKKILDESHDKSIVILEGQMNMDFIDAACSEFNITHYKIILIDCSNDVRHARLSQGRNQSELINETMDNWAKFLRKQAAARDVPVLDTTSMTIKQMVDCFKAF